MQTIPLLISNTEQEVNMHAILKGQYKVVIVQTTTASNPVSSSIVVCTVATIPQLTAAVTHGDQLRVDMYYTKPIKSTWKVHNQHTVEIMTLCIIWCTLLC